MSSVVFKLTFDKNTKKEEIKKEVNEILHRERLLLSGNIEFKDTKIFDTQEEAEEYLDNSRFEHDSIGVLFNDYSGINIKSAKLISLEQDLEETNNKLRNYRKEHSVKNFKAEFITCKKCGSRINKKYIQFEMCPLCDNSFKSETVKKTINNYLTKMEKINDLIKVERNKLERKLKKDAKVKWLVKAVAY